ncbi:FAD-dependent oxidoreductase [Actinoalloteichus hymeniacidonis]|uniref:Cholesterol oxidase n=1 Tax=Actinoalloteichus hymeniacidonis TaxID=340345 RepID=A0AAC9HQM3_9PSEU|nr:GMC family oxidoreductase [Actinoalloteichus hymeniacidonis]AOS63724.1 choline dehydrogenase-like flavoprotein [Actinoalloteichus hymeniacidonis]MBB5908223.1 cholesterol oxidase [Actinoalloteichus hymeniacidonis]
MTDRFDADAIVVGSGFGGAVAAARLAQAGFSVIVLERGRRWGLGDFPRAPELTDGWLWDLDRGLYDIRWLDSMGSVQAAGWGGGSLVYANVFARPFEQTLDERWPAHLRREELDPYYDLAAHMLGVSPVGKDPRTGKIPPRTDLMEQLLEGTDRDEATVRPNLAVTFGDPDTWKPNIHGVARRGCAFVGECVIGCNHGAKNTLDYTYLAVAEQAGARAVTDAQVTRIEHLGESYRIHVSTPSDPEAAERTWVAPKVVLAAGAVATNELLLRSRDVHRTLPGLSRQLGKGFSGNGDFLTLAELRGKRPDMTTGPTITTNTVLDVPEGRRPVWYQVQDGAFPPPLNALFDSILPARRARDWWQRSVRHTEPRQTFTVLAMGKDSGKGTLRLDTRGDATLAWNNRWQAQLYRSQTRVGPFVARLLDARLYNPFTWSLLRRTITVHPLGGVRSGRDAATGVVDAAGEAHGYPGLFVMDGSVIPAATGVNPSATILAAAERSMETMIRRSGRIGWRAPEWESVIPAEVPEDGAYLSQAKLHAATKGDGLIFAEQMATDAREHPRMVLSLHAEIPGIDPFLADGAHTVQLRGLVDIDDVATQMDISGTLSLFPVGRREAMVYSLRFDDDRGRPWQLSGTKTVRSRNPVDLLSGLTMLRTEVSPVDAEPDEVQRFVLTIGTRDLARLGRSIRGRAFTRSRRLRAASRFVSFFAISALRRRTR